MTPRLNAVLLILALVVGLPFYWLMIDNRPGDVPPKPIAVTQLRALAASIPGPRPVEAEMYRIGYNRALGDLYVAGSGIKRRGIGVLAWVLPVPGRGGIVIDTGMTAAQARAQKVGVYDRHQQGAIDAAMHRADLILVTHEHLDHIGGLAALHDPAAQAHAALNPRQLPGPAQSSLGWQPGAAFRVIAQTGPVAVAPGVVVIPAPSHSPGSQLIFVTLADGTELLFAGDVSSLASNWRRLRARSRLNGDILTGENRDEVYAWLKTIRAWKQQAPQMVVIPGHDVEYLDKRKFRGIRSMLPIPKLYDPALANAGNF